MILAGDIGGTNCRLAIFRPGSAGLEAIWRKAYPSREHAGLVAILRLAREEIDLEVDAASFGIAGPVREQKSRATNLPWNVDASELARELALERVGLFNDLEANALGLLGLAEKDLRTLHAGARDARGNMALIAAGTGLGEAGLFFDGREHRPWACEGGHAGFSPSSEFDVELWRFLAARHGSHVSWERVLSGPGIAALYEFVLATERAQAPAWLAERYGHADKSAVVTEAALAGQDERCLRVLEHFVRLFAVEASNLALKVLASGGVYLGGGIAPRIQSLLERPAFLETFFAKGRMRPLLEDMPIRIILEPDTALLGAARHAALAAGCHGALAADRSDPA